MSDYDKSNVARLNSPLVAIPECGLLMSSDLVWDALRQQVEDVYARAEAEMESVPLVADEPWEEGTQAYAARIGVEPHLYIDRHGRDKGLPRARLTRGPDRIADLDVVEVTEAVKNDRGTDVPAGTQGTVVAIWGRGQAYEIEFWDGTDEYGYSLATVPAEHARLVTEGEG